MDFPENIVRELKSSLAAIEGVDIVLRRPLRPTDPTGSLGVYASMWDPSEFEIGQYDPAVTRYQVILQSMIKHGNEEEGVSEHAALAKRIRVMLYRDEALRVRLHSLSISDGGLAESVRRYGVTRQNYLNNELQGTFLFLAVTELWFDTEIS